MSDNIITITAEDKEDSFIGLVIEEDTGEVLERTCNLKHDQAVFMSLFLEKSFKENVVPRYLPSNFCSDIPW